MIPVLRRPSPESERRPPGKRARKTHVGVVIICCEPEEDHYVAQGVVYLAKEANFVARGTKLQDHITHDPVTEAAKAFSRTSRHRVGCQDFREWCPPAAVQVLRTIVFYQQPVLKDIYMCTYVCILCFKRSFFSYFDILQKKYKI